MRDKSDSTPQVEWPSISKCLSVFSGYWVATTGYPSAPASPVLADSQTPICLRLHKIMDKEHYPQPVDRLIVASQLYLVLVQKRIYRACPKLRVSLVCRPGEGERIRLLAWAVNNPGKVDCRHRWDSCYFHFPPPLLC